MTSVSSLIDCTSCDRTIPADSAACGYCGVKARKGDERKLCTACGNSVSGDETYCGHCGSRVANERTLSRTDDTLPARIVSPSSGLQQTSASEISTTSVFLIATGVTVLFVGFVWVAYSLNKTSADASVNMTSASQGAVPVPQSSHILTKDAEFMKLFHPATADESLEQSPEYRAKRDEVEAKLASIQDPDLKKRLADEEWGKVDIEEYKRRAAVEQRNAIAVGLRRCIERHRGDWFELGHLSFTGADSVHVTSVEASPIDLPNGADIPISISTMDDVYSRFRQIALPQMQQMGQAWVNQQSCKAKLQNVCRNLGGSENECSDPAKLNEITQSLGGGGILSDCNDNASLNDGMRNVETKMRGERIVLVGQGDLIAHRIDKLLIVDYDSETVLHELSQNVLPNDLLWKFADDKNRGLFSSSTYRPPADSALQPDFGVTPVGSEGRTINEIFVNQSESQQEVTISLQGDSTGDFELSNGCSSATIDAKDHCTVIVTFKPKSLGLHTATLSAVGTGMSWQPVLLGGFGAWPWDIYRGERGTGTKQAAEAQPTIPLGNGSAKEASGCPTGSEHPKPEMNASENRWEFAMVCKKSGELNSLLSDCPAGWSIDSQGHGSLDRCIKSASASSKGPS